MAARSAGAAVRNAGDRAPELQADTDAQLMFSFRQGLSAGGFVEDRNVVVDYRYAQGQPSRLPLLAPIWFDVRRPSS
jgi:hypothetical protein